MPGPIDRAPREGGAVLRRSPRATGALRGGAGPAVEERGGGSPRRVDTSSVRGRGVIRLGVQHPLSPGRLAGPHVDQAHPIAGRHADLLHEGPVADGDDRERLGRAVGLERGPAPDPLRCALNVEIIVLDTAHVHLLDASNQEQRRERSGLDNLGSGPRDHAEGRIRAPGRGQPAGVPGGSGRPSALAKEREDRRGRAGRAPERPVPGGSRRSAGGTWEARRPARPSRRPRDRERERGLSTIIERSGCCGIMRHKGLPWRLAAKQQRVGLSAPKGGTRVCHLLDGVAQCGVGLNGIVSGSVISSVAFRLRGRPAEKEAPCARLLRASWRPSATPC